MSADKVVDAQSTRPKKPFLRRGEGTKRRVFASKYIDEAKRLREENLQRAQCRQNVRNESPVLPSRIGFVEHDSLPIERNKLRQETFGVRPDDCFMSLVNTRTSILSPREQVVNDDDAVKDQQAFAIFDEKEETKFIFGTSHPSSQNLSFEKEKQRLHSSLSPLQRDVTKFEDKLKLSHSEDKAEVSGSTDSLQTKIHNHGLKSPYPEGIDQEKATTEQLLNDDTRVDGTCRVSSPTVRNADDSFAFDNDEQTLLRKETRKTNWLESQRRCEERQWAEVINLKC